MSNAARVCLLLSCLVLVTYGIRTTRRAAEAVAVHADPEPVLHNAEYTRAADEYKALDRVPEDFHHKHRHEIEPEYKVDPADEKVAPEIVRNDEVETNYTEHEYVDNMDVKVGPPPPVPTEVVGTRTIAEEVDRLPEQYTLAELKADATEQQQPLTEQVPPAPPAAPAAAAVAAGTVASVASSMPFTMVVPSKMPPPGFMQPAPYEPVQIPAPYVAQPDDSDEEASPAIPARLRDDDYDERVVSEPIIVKRRRHHNDRDHEIRPWHPHHEYIEPHMLPANENIPTVPPPNDTIPNPWQTLHEIRHIKKEANKIQQAEVLQALHNLHEDAEKLRDEIEDNEEKLQELRDRARRMSDVCKVHRHGHRFAEVDPVLAEIMNNVEQAEQAAVGATVLHAQFKATMRAVVSELAALQTQVQQLPIAAEPSNAAAAAPAAPAATVNPQ